MDAPSIENFESDCSSIHEVMPAGIFRHEKPQHLALGDHKIDITNFERVKQQTQLIQIPSPFDLEACPHHASWNKHPVPQQPGVCFFAPLTTNAV